MTRFRARLVRTRWYLPLLVLILLLALLLRVWLWHDQATAWSVGLGDEDEYYRGAIHILLQGDYYDTGKWLRPPVTSLYLAGAFATLGVNLPLALLFESALSLLAIAIVARLVKNIFGRKDYSLVAASSVAFFLPFAAYASRILSETLFIIFLALAMLLLERAQARVRANRGSDGILLLSGIALGLGILTRAFLFYYVVLLLFWLYWETRRITRTARLFVPLAAGVILTVAPWTIRNSLVYHQLVFVDTESGYSFLNGADPGVNEDALQTYWLRAYSNSADRQRAQFAAGIEIVRRAPLQWIGRMRDKIVGLWHLHVRNLANNGMRGATLQMGSVDFSLASDVEYVVLMLAALIGLVVVPRGRLFLPLLGLPIYTTLVGAVTVTSVRIREPIMLVPIVYAALVLANPRGAWQDLAAASRVRKLLFATGVVIFLVLIYSSSYLGFLSGRIWLALANLGQGEPAIRSAIAADPDNVFPYLALGRSELERGDTNDALSSLNQASQVMPDNTDVQAELIQVFRLKGEDEAALAAVQSIAEAGWDNPQWYEWAWSRVPFAPKSQVDMSAPAVGAMSGVYPVAGVDAVPFRWTIDRADFRVAAPGASTLTLTLRADNARSVQVFLDGEFLQTIQVTETWADYKMRLEKTAGDQSVIGLRTPARVAGINEPYARGVAVEAVKLDSP